MTKLQLFEEAISYYGLEETINGKFNDQVLKMLNSSSPAPVKSNLPWCAAYVNWVLKSNGFKHSDLLTARSLLKIGRAVKEPKLGDIVVFWRGKENSWKGHVGFYVRTVGNVIYVLGGNQNNSVCIKPYPISRLLSYRRIGEIK